MRDVSLMNRCSQATPSRGCAEHHSDGGTAGTTGCDLQLAPDTFRSLRHDRKTEPTFGTLRRNTGTVVGDFDSCERRINFAAYPEILGTSVLAGIGDRFLR